MGIPEHVSADARQTRSALKDQGEIMSASVALVCHSRRDDIRVGRLDARRGHESKVHHRQAVRERIHGHSEAWRSRRRRAEVGTRAIGLQLIYVDQ